MFDITVNLAYLFQGCIPFKKTKQKHKEIKIKNFLNSLKNKSAETKVNLIMEKIVNHKHSVGLLYEVQNENTFKLICFYGESDQNSVKYLNGNITPIFIDMTLKYLLVICQNQKNNKDKIDDDLLEILKDNL